jgi:hypothetical protein
VLDAPLVRGVDRQLTLDAVDGLVVAAVRVLDGDLPILSAVYDQVRHLDRLGDAELRLLAS